MKQNAAASLVFPVCLGKLAATLTVAGSVGSRFPECSHRCSSPFLQHGLNCPCVATESGTYQATHLSTACLWLFGASEWRTAVSLGTYNVNLNVQVKLFLGAFVKLRKATIGLVMPVCPSA